MKLSFLKKKRTEKEKAPEPATTPTPVHYGPTTKILIIDDEETFGRLTKMNLEKHGGFDVKTETKARHAVQSAIDFGPDLILLDVMLLDGDGGQVAAALQDRPALKDIPIVFLTAAIKRDESGHHSRQIGGRTYIPKPIKTDELVACIKEVLAA